MDATWERRVGGTELVNSNDGSICGDQVGAAGNHDYFKQQVRVLGEHVGVVGITPMVGIKRKTKKTLRGGDRGEQTI